MAILCGLGERPCFIVHVLQIDMHRIYESINNAQRYELSKVVGVFNNG